MEKEEQQKLLRSMVFPAILVAVLWIVKIIELLLHTSFADYGLEPQSWQGLRGIFLSPFLHADFKHLSANSVPLFLLAAGLFYYYPKKANSIFILLWLVTGLWVWVFAADTGVHIGASGVVYALAMFHFMSGVLRREPRMMAFALLVVFLYGGLVWGVIPNFFPDRNISWQSHLMGALAGLVIAVAYRREGPQRKVYEWPDEDEDDDDNAPWNETQLDEDTTLRDDSQRMEPPQIRINYDYKEKNPGI